MDPAKYAELFLAESRAHLTTLNQQLVAWENDRESGDYVGTIFRAVHTIKGMAATMGYAVVADVAHHSENLLDLLRGRDDPVEAETLDLLFQAADLLEHTVEKSVVGESDDVEPDALLAELDRVAEALSGVKKRRSRRSRASAATAAVEPVVGGRPVSVALRSDAPIKGARALLILKKLEPLGTAAGVRPAPSSFEADEFDGRFAFRIHTEASDAEVEACIRAAGDVEDVEFGDRDESESARGERALAQQTRHIRVDLRRFDRLMSLIGELVTARSRLAEISGERADTDLEDVTLRITHLTGALQTEIIDVRMTPVWHVFDRFPRLVRDVARQLDKRVRFEVEGKEIELDRAILDEISDPLVHMLRNAVDHGIEPPEERAAAGKPPVGRVTLSAARDRSTVVIRVADDGRGIDRAQILADAKARTLVEADVEELSSDALVSVLAQPGFSTAGTVSEVSGRGVGIDVVSTQIQQLGGTLEVETTPGAGATFTLRLPPTLAILPALLAAVGDERYALPLTHVQETVDLSGASVTEIEGSEALVLRDQVVPLVHLRGLVGINGQDVPAQRPVIILQVGARQTGVVVDSLLGQREIVVKGFDAPRGTLPIFSGATILGDGRPVLILDAARLM